ncbi:undecaprenyldiphospho-muramoylpentapeptide beta-N-acetylglucosaminyltransferase [Nitriliruptor alkaliphilus]|uniref:undecaprenyldiphospho-muramoylpentapeptide beta-N-acetylglucosaminyltransferase n=1 Tax=Nitriliruptor alkaliphilus TaxID=427918 RepID=UPI000696C35D|nr:undecaprenyldiphospho-muramoylpentapeptide beta-N-acetylglucosaminyltransferase [Nitriliruptor alkaliphilus]
MTRRVLVAGGGTAGHVFPALAVARALTVLDPGIEPVFVGVPDRLEADLVPAAGFRIHHVDAVAVPRRISTKLLRLPGAVRSAVRRCEEIVEEEGALGVVTFGGYVSFPVSWAAARRDLPLVIHEQNAVPGLANRVSSRWADRIAVTVPGSADRFRRAERAAVTGNPVRQEVLELDRAARRAAARERFGLQPDLPTLLVFGGSQGARQLNRAIVDALARWRTDRLQVLHAAGRSLFAESAAAWERARASAGGGPTSRLVDFIDDMSDAYAAADVVVCRAGATSIAELTVLGVPAVLVPYPHATGDHQTRNAEALANAGGAVMVSDDELDGASLVAAVEPLLTDPERHAAVAAAARAFGRPDAATNVARLLLDLLPATRKQPDDPEGST